jgi:hypothetical protein
MPRKPLDLTTELGLRAVLHDRHWRLVWAPGSCLDVVREPTRPAARRCDALDPRQPRPRAIALHAQPARKLSTLWYCLSIDCRSSEVKSTIARYEYSAEIRSGSSTACLDDGSFRVASIICRSLRASTSRFRLKNFSILALSFSTFGLIVYRTHTVRARKAETIRKARSIIAQAPFLTVFLAECQVPTGT